MKYRGILVLAAAVMLMSGCNVEEQNQYLIAPEEEIPSESSGTERFDDVFDALCTGGYAEVSANEAFVSQSDYLQHYTNILKEGIFCEEYDYSSGETERSIRREVFYEWVYYRRMETVEYEVIARDTVGYEILEGTVLYQSITLPKGHSLGRSELDTLPEKTNYADSVNFTVNGKTYLCERYTGGNHLTCYIAFDEEGTIQSITTTNGTDYTFIRNYSLSADGGSYLSEEAMRGLYKYCENASADVMPEPLPTEAPEVHYENDIFDFSADRIRGKTIENPHIVENCREFFDTAEEFSVSISARRGDLMMWNYATKSGDDYYSLDGLKKGDENAIITEDLFTGGEYYWRCYSEDEPEEFELNAPSHALGLYIYYLIQNNDNPLLNYEAKFQEAYEVRVGDEDYICEVWTMSDNGKEYNVYCKDGAVVAIDVIFYDKHEETIIEYLYDQAEAEHLQPPEHYITRSYNENQ